MACPPLAVPRPSPPTPSSRRPVLWLDKLLPQAGGSARPTGAGSAARRCWTSGSWLPVPSGAGSKEEKGYTPPLASGVPQSCTGEPPGLFVCICLTLKTSNTWAATPEALCSVPFVHWLCVHAPQQHHVVGTEVSPIFR